MSTRKKRHAGNRQRGWEEVNKSIGQDGRMESEAWYMALQALPDTDAATTVLVEHFGTLQNAERSFRALSEVVSNRFEAVRAVFEET